MGLARLGSAVVGLEAQCACPGAKTAKGLDASHSPICSEDSGCWSLGTMPCSIAPFPSSGGVCAWLDPPQ